MLLVLFISLLLLSLLTFPGHFVSAACQSNAVPVNPNKPTIRLGTYEWLSSIVNTEVIKILIEERFGYPCEIIDISNYEVYLALEDLKVDAVFEFWATERPEYAEELRRPIYAHVGVAGFSGREGWYVPDYVMDFNPDFFSWKGLRLLDNVNIFRDDYTGNLTTDKNIYERINEQTELISSFTNETSQEEFQEATSVLNNLVKSIQADFNNTADESLFGDFYTPTPEEGWLTQDERLIRELNLPLKARYIPMNVEENLVKMVREKYQARQPFITYLYSPLQIFDPRSGVKMKRIQLFDWPSECDLNPELLECVYPPDVIKSVISTSLEPKSIIVNSFMKQYRLRSADDVNSLLADIKFYNMTPQEAACEFIKSNQEYLETLYPLPQSLVYIDWASGAGITLTVLASFFILLSIAILVYFNLNRKNPVVLASSLRFCNAILIGSILGYIGMFMFMGVPNHVVCAFRPIFMVLSFSIIYTHLLIKNFRIWRIFTKPFASSNRYLKDKNLFIASGVVITLQLVLVIVWFVVDFPIPQEVEFPGEVVLDCWSVNQSFGKAMFWSLFIINCVLIFIGLFLAVETRKVNSKFRESRYIGISTYNVIVLAFIFLPFLIVRGMTTAINQKVLLCVLIIAVPAVIILVLFVPKVIYIIKPEWTPSYDSSGEWSAANPKKMPGQKKETSELAGKESREMTNINTISNPAEEVAVIEEALDAIHTGNYGSGY